MAHLIGKALRDRASLAGTSTGCNARQAATVGCAYKRLHWQAAYKWLSQKDLSTFLAACFNGTRLPLQLVGWVPTTPLDNMFGKSPAKVPTDEVVPLWFFDDARPWKNFILYSTFVYDDVLDPQVLRTSLETLATRDGWRKLGARLRRSNKGTLEYHIPTSFSAGRRPLAFTHVVHNMPAAEHPVAARLPKTLPPDASHAAVVGDPDELRPLFHPKGFPSTLDDYLKADVPQLGLHVVSFSDKTVVVLHWPHTLMDAMGKRAVLDAWMLVLHGRADEVAVPQGTVSDPLADLGTRPTEPYRLSDHHLSLWGLAAYGLSNLRNILATQENRMVCVPAAVLKRLQARADADLAAAPSPDRPAFASEGDVICAWWTRLATAHLKSLTNRAIVLNLAFSLRRPLAGDRFEAPATPDGRVTYVSNAVAFVFVRLTAHDVATLPLGLLAARIRAALIAQRTRPQIEAYAALWRTSPGRMPPMVGERTMHMITYSNWCKARMFDLDLSPAVVATTAAAPAKTGLPSYIQNNQSGLVLPDGFPILGKDAVGNIWLSGYMNRGVWRQIEAALAEESV